MNKATLGASAPILTQDQAAAKLHEFGSRASCMSSLARAAQVITSGDGLYEDERSIVVADIVEVIHYLSVDLMHAARAMGDAAEKITS